MHRWWAAAFRTPDSGPSGSTGGGTGNGTPTFTSTQVKEIATAVANEPDLARAVAAAIERSGGNKEKGVEYALRQGYKARRQRDDILAENTRVATLVPAQGDLVLKGDEAKHVGAIIANAKKASLSLADLATKVESLPQTESRLKELEDMRTAADAAGARYNQKALAKAVTDDGMVFVKLDVKSTTKDSEGKSVTKNESLWHVKRPNQKDNEALLVDKYVDEHVFKAAILGKGSAQSDVSSSVDWPRQSSNDSASNTGGDSVSKHLETVNKRATAPSALDFAFGVQATQPHSGAGAAQDAQRKS